MIPACSTVSELNFQIHTHSSILAWKIPWTEEPGELQSKGLKELETTERLSKYSIKHNLENISGSWCLVDVTWRRQKPENKKKMLQEVKSAHNFL